MVAIQECLPELHSITFNATSAEVKILNRYHFGVCLDGQYATGNAYCGCQYCGEDPHTPVLISLGDGAVRLTSVDDGVLFDLDADGVPEEIAWTEADGDEAFLALDRNDNGLIDDGVELFGNRTPQPEPEVGQRNGFAALALFDDILSGGNEDGVIDSGDSVYSELRLWLDSNHNGTADPGELLTLPEGNVVSIDLGYSESPRVDGFGNEFRYSTRVQMTGPMRIAWDVVFQRGADEGDS